MLKNISCIMESGRYQTKPNPGRDTLVRTKELIETWFSLFLNEAKCSDLDCCLQAGMEGLGCKWLVALQDLHAYDTSGSTMLREALSSVHTNHNKKRNSVWNENILWVDWGTEYDKLKP